MRKPRPKKTAPAFTIRLFDPARDSIDVLTELMEGPDDAARAWWKESLYRRLEPKNLFVAEADGTLVGMVMLYDAGFPGVSSEGLFVRPAYRKRGIGAALVSALMTEARARGASVYFRFGNEASAKFFESLGVPIRDGLTGQPMRMNVLRLT